ncbi:MAG TPA: hypothetical protein PLS69_09040 [Terricaulis sp.]|nr:hypothetical protein [Terricaulis sp.]HRP10995.1 hypothetical protein [Terricaulis sp.]
MKLEALLALLTFVGIIAAWLVVPALVPDDRGYTAIGALFTGLAFAGFVFTTAVQRRDIRQAELAQRRAQMISSGAAVASSLGAYLQYVQAEVNRSLDRSETMVGGQLREVERALLVIQDQLAKNPSGVPSGVGKALEDSMVTVRDALKDVAEIHAENQTRLPKYRQLREDFNSQLSSLVAGLASIYNQDFAAVAAGLDKDGAKIESYLKKVAF